MVPLADQASKGNHSDDSQLADGTWFHCNKLAIRKFCTLVDDRPRRQCVKLIQRHCIDEVGNEKQTYVAVISIYEEGVRSEPVASVHES